MSTNVISDSPFLRTSRSFPEEAQPLAVEINRSYVDIAQKVNDRVIGFFSTNRPAQTGESWFITSQRQRSLRQLYLFTAAGNIPHGINWQSVALISPRSYGTFTDGTNWYGAIYASNTAIAGQVSFYVTNTNIVVLSGGGAPVITQGYINLEWVANT